LKISGIGAYPDSYGGGIACLFIIAVAGMLTFQKQHPIPAKNAEIII
jgi:hypothetical protein